MDAPVRNRYASSMHKEIDTYGFVYKARDQLMCVYIHT